MKLFIYEEDEITQIKCYVNFRKFYLIDWTNSKIIGWETYVNKILGNTGKFYYGKYSRGEEYIEFNTEEDMINFLLRWT